MPEHDTAARPARSWTRLVWAAAGVCALGATTLPGGLPAVTAALPGTLPAVAVDPRPPTDWQVCPAYSDDALKALGVAHAELSAAHALLARMRCGTVEVPLDYRKPNGTKIEIAFTELPATDRAHRLGSLALNPGGPGGSGYLMGFQLALSATSAALNQRYDLIGFDPRGVGYSTKVDCPPPKAPPGGSRPPAPGPLTEAAAKLRYDETVSQNAACAGYNPTFLGQLTTTNVARDLDQIRRALNEPRISYFGVSWGTWLGVVYRNLFPVRTAQMWLDSTAPPEPRNDAYQAAKAKATTRDFARMAAWIAERDGIYGFGTSTDRVAAALARMRQDFDANPRTFTDLPDVLFDGSIIAGLSAQNSSQWPVLAEALKELRNATGTSAPPGVKKVFGGPGDQPPPEPPPANLPERRNETAGLALNCNDDTGDRTFEAAWATYREELTLYPVTGEAAVPAVQCAGWPLPVEKVRLRHSNVPLQLSGHRWETISAYEFTLQTLAAVGGHILTVDDDVHGSTVQEASCAPKVVAYFNTGKPQTGHCAGAAVPTR
jgi:pimeloyl-ACP methyl ester carboxylesterase